MITHLFSPSVIATVNNHLMGGDIEWYYASATCGDQGGCKLDSKTLDTAQFVHYMYVDGVVTSDIFTVVHPIIVELEEKLQRPFFSRLQRVKANMVMCNPTFDENCYHTPHVDHYSTGAETLLYYVNNSDGGTTFFDATNALRKIHTQNPNAGTGVLFDSTMYHAGSSPKRTERRVVINFVFNPEPAVN
jgi:hypothetical protein